MITAFDVASRRRTDPGSTLRQRALEEGAAIVRALWHSDRVLTGTAVILLAALIPMSIGLWLDPRQITGAPAWLKPAKFALSTAVYSLTLAWIFQYIRAWPRVRVIVGRMTAAVMLLEVGLITLQAGRGTTSHFNFATPVDAAIFAVMGLAIVAQTFASTAVAFALWRERFADAAVGWALRLGMTLTIVGALTGGLMTRPTAPQLQAARATHQMPTSGAHTVGGPDGGPGLPGTGWSVAHGDLRIPHFLGLHALQILGLFVLLLRRRLAAVVRTQLIVAAAWSYAVLFAILMWQALRGQSIVRPDALSIGVLSLWAAATLAAMMVVRGRALRVDAVRAR